MASIGQTPAMEEEAWLNSRCWVGENLETEAAMVSEPYQQVSEPDPGYVEAACGRSRALNGSGQEN